MLKNKEQIAQQLRLTADRVEAGMYAHAHLEFSKDIRALGEQNSWQITEAGNLHLNLTLGDSRKDIP